MDKKNFTKKSLATLLATISMVASSTAAFADGEADPIDPPIVGDTDENGGSGNTDDNGGSGNTDDTNQDETEPTEEEKIAAAKATLKEVIDTAEGKDSDGNSIYTYETVTNGTIWAELSDALSRAKEIYTQPESTLEDITTITSRLSAAIESADQNIADDINKANQEKVAGIKKEIEDLLATVTVSDTDLFPSVWETLNTAMTNANDAINNDELLYADAVKIKSDLNTAINVANENAKIKIEVDAAKKTLSETLKSINFNENAVNAELWETLQTAISNANKVLENAEAVLDDVTTAQNNLDAAIEAVDKVANGTITLTDISTNIAIMGMGLEDTYKFTATTSTTDSGALIITPSITDSDGNEVNISNIIANNDDIASMKLIIPLTKSFDGVDKVYFYTLNSDKTVYTALDETTALTIAIKDNLLTMDITSLNTLAMSRVALKEDGTVDTSGTEEIPTTSITDKTSNVEISSDTIDFTGASLSANIDSSNDTQTVVDFSITTETGTFDFAGNTATISIPLSGAITDASKVYVYSVDSKGVYTEIKNSNLMFKHISFTISSDGKYVISSIELNENGKVDSGTTETPVYTQKVTSTLSNNEFNNLLTQNTTQDVVISNNGVEFKFKKGTMNAVSGAVYNFQVATESNYNSLDNPLKAITKDNLVLFVDYKYEGDLPAMAEITLNVGTKYAGKTLYYSQVFSDHAVEVQRVVVAANGYVTVTQDHCSDYVFTTERIVTSNTPSTNDPSIEESFPVTVKSDTHDISLTTRTVLPNGAKLDLNVTNINNNTTKYSSFVIKNGIGVPSTLKGKATLSIPLGDKFSDAEAVYVYVTDALTPIKSEIKDGYIIFDVEDITKLVAISTEKWTAEATPAEVVSMVVKKTTLKDDNITLDGMLPENIALKTEKLERNTTSYGVTIGVVNSKGTAIAFNDEFMNAKVSITLDETYENADNIYVYAISKVGGRVVYTNADYKKVNSTVVGNKLSFSIDTFGTYVISMVELDKNGNYADANAIEVAKTALNKYIKTLNIDTTKYDTELVTKYTNALKVAKDIIKNDDATLVEVNKASDNLKKVVNTINDITKIANIKTNLQKQIDEAKKIDTTKYESNLVNRFKNLLKFAEEAVANKTITLNEITTSYNNLVSVMNEIKEADKVIQNKINTAKKELQTIVDTKVDLTNVSDYIVEKYNSAKKNAIAVISNKGATLKNVEDAKTALKEAIDAVNDNYTIETAKTALKEMLSNKVDSTKYTTASYKVYTDAVTNANKVLNNNTATLKDIDTAKNILKLAIDGLVEVTAENNTPDNSDTSNSNENNSSENESGNTSNGNDSGNISIPDTGVDATTPISIAAVSAVALAAVIAMNKKRKDNDE